MLPSVVIEVSVEPVVVDAIVVLCPLVGYISVEPVVVGLIAVVVIPVDTEEVDVAGLDVTQASLLFPLRKMITIATIMRIIKIMVRINENLLNHFMLFETPHILLVSRVSMQSVRTLNS